MSAAISGAEPQAPALDGLLQERLPRLDWPPVASHVSLLRGRQHPEAPVLLTLFPPRPQPGQPQGFSTYFPAMAGQVLNRDPALFDAIEAGLHANPGHSLGLVVNAALPQPLDWGTQPEHFPIRRSRKGQALSAAEQQAYQAERCQLWNSGRGEPWCAPKQWGASIEHIGPCEWLFAECDLEGFPPAGQLALATGVFDAPPSFTIHTGGKSLHCYYHLTRPIPPADWARLQGLVIALYGAIEPEARVDSSLKKANQVLRLAGGFHPRTGCLASIHTCTGTLVDPEALERHLRGLLPPPPAPPPRPPLHRRTSAPRTRHAGRVPTLRDIADALATVPRRQQGHGGYSSHRNLLWGLIKAVEEAGGSIETAIALMEAHSPSSICGWDVGQVARSGGDQATPGWFWAQAGGHPSKRQEVRS